MCSVCREELPIGLGSEEIPLYDKVDCSACGRSYHPYCIGDKALGMYLLSKKNGTSWVCEAEGCGGVVGTLEDEFKVIEKAANSREDLTVPTLRAKLLTKIDMTDLLLNALLELVKDAKCTLTDLKEELLNPTDGSTYKERKMRYNNAVRINDLFELERSLSGDRYECRAVEYNSLLKMKKQLENIVKDIKRKMKRKICPPILLSSFIAEGDLDAGNILMPKIVLFDSP